MGSDDHFDAALLDDRFPRAIARAGKYQVAESALVRQNARRVRRSGCRDFERCRGCSARGANYTRGTAFVRPAGSDRERLIEVRLTQGIEVHVLVTDPQGRPYPNAEVLQYRGG